MILEAVETWYKKGKTHRTVGFLDFIHKQVLAKPELVNLSRSMVKDAWRNMVSKFYEHQDKLSKSGYMGAKAHFEKVCAGRKIEV